ncbi:hypothetical protein ACFQY4_17415 [Catellatospora bangladeshensis]|uniref:Uncharacterized protein n=1 Tax=Catellatospora bangladeshensis TaxID=310355 RepID=A0A8J3NNF7_9ACTN|nr:hypothetical protein [Catellatospora bangladeshensis]GIF86276.1 hypothetical protein Cba03nite_76250 [Catellatospora bangladeshensis]
MVSDVAQIIGLVAIAITLYFASQQTKRLRQQVDLANLFSRYEALNHASERYDNGLALIFQRPELRPYVFQRKPLDLTGDDLARVLTVADLMAGAVDYALRVGARFPDDPSSDWTAVAVEMARQPVFQALVQEQPHQFPDLIRHFVPGPSEPATEV